MLGLICVLTFTNIIILQVFFVDYFELLITHVLVPYINFIYKRKNKKRILHIEILSESNWNGEIVYNTDSDNEELSKLSPLYTISKEKINHNCDEEYESQYDDSEYEDSEDNENEENEDSEYEDSEYEDNENEDTKNEDTKNEENEGNQDNENIENEENEENEDTENEDTENEENKNEDNENTENEDLNKVTFKSIIIENVD
jgi:hypothetical protein